MAQANAKIATSDPVPEPKGRAKAAIEHAKARVLARRDRVAVKVASVNGTIVDVGATHSDDVGQYYHLLDTFGTASNDFMATTFSQTIEALRDAKGTPTQLTINAALAVIGGLQPENEVEALLAAQMAATHGLAMIMLGRARRVELLAQIEVQGSLAVKLLRTFTMQAETLAKLRRGGGQTVRVEHVHVHSGGQAVVGNVGTGGGLPIKNEDLPHAKLASLSHADAPFDPLRSTNTANNRVPVSRHA